MSSLDTAMIMIITTAIIKIKVIMVIRLIITIILITMRIKMIQ